MFILGGSKANTRTKDQEVNSRFISSAGTLSFFPVQPFLKCFLSINTMHILCSLELTAAKNTEKAPRLTSQPSSAAPSLRHQHSLRTQKSCIYNPLCFQLLCVTSSLFEDYGVTFGKLLNSEVIFSPSNFLIGNLHHTLWLKLLSSTSFHTDLRSLFGMIPQNIVIHKILVVLYIK